jgi:hypothetical protein
MYHTGIDKPQEKQKEKFDIEVIHDLMSGKISPKKNCKRRTLGYERSYG